MLIAAANYQMNRSLPAALCSTLQGEQSESATWCMILLSSAGRPAGTHATCYMLHATCHCIDLYAHGVYCACIVRVCSGHLNTDRQAPARTELCGS